MTLLLVIAIIIAVVFSVFCVLCLHTMFLTRRETEESKTRITQLEKNIGDVSELVTAKTEELVKKLDEQTTAQKVETPAAALESEPVSEIKTDNESLYETAGIIEELDDEIDLDDLFGESEPEEIEEIDLEGIELEDIEPEESIPEEPAVIVQEQKEEITPEKPEENVPEKTGENMANDPDLVMIRPESIPEMFRIKHHTGYDVGKSGKKYNAAELDMLIRE